MPALPTADLDHILQWTPRCWDSLRDARLFITGGTGFFGSWLIESLVWAADRLKIGVEVVVLTRAPDEFALKNSHLADHRAEFRFCDRGDIRHFDFPDGQFTHVIHAAFPSGGPRPRRPMRRCRWYWRGPSGRSHSPNTQTPATFYSSVRAPSTADNPPSCQKFPRTIAVRRIPVILGLPTARPSELPN